MAVSPLTENTDPYARLGVRPVINACGIYTDLGGACLSETVWSALARVNQEWASIPELLEASGERIASLVGSEAARVVPGAAASIALGVAASIAGHDSYVNEHLPDIEMPRRTVVLQRGHQYKYARCVPLGGGRIVERDVRTRDELAEALGDHVAAILHPAHLDGHEGTLSLRDVVDVARSRAVWVIVDAAYLSYPTDQITHWVGSGADLVCFSAKYFYGPNAGGFIAGRRDAIDTVHEVDFTNFEAGPHLTFGRPFKLDRTAIVATVLALKEWLALDHDARWQGYERRVDSMRDELAAASPSLRTRKQQFTLDERLTDGPPNSLVVELDAESQAVAAEERLADGEPRIFCVPMQHRLIFCVETVRPEQDEALVARILDVAPSAGS